MEGGRTVGRGGEGQTDGKVEPCVLRCCDKGEPLLYLSFFYWNFIKFIDFLKLLGGACWLFVESDRCSERGRRIRRGV